MFLNFVFATLIVAMLFYWINICFFNEANIISNVGKLSTLIANVLLIYLLASRWIVAGYFPLSNLYESLSFLTWALLSISLYYEEQNKSRLIGPILIPIALLLTGFASLTLPVEMQKSSPLVPSLQSNWLMLHVSMMIISYATLIIGSLMCVLYLIISEIKPDDIINYSVFDKVQNELHMIKNEGKIFISSEDLITSGKKVPQFSRSLEDIFYIGKFILMYRLDNWSYRLIGLGCPFLTIGIISGAVWANEAWGSYWSWDPKETWALITWSVFITFLHARLVKKWKGKKSAELGSLGFVVIWICYLGVNFLSKGLHSYGWVH